MLQLKTNSNQTNILLALLVVLMALLVVLQYLSLKSTPNSSPNTPENRISVTPPATTTTPSVSQETYSNNKFIFNYPSNWVIYSSKDDSVSFTTSSGNQVHIVSVIDSSKTISDYLVKADKISQTSWEGKSSIQVQSTKKTLINNLNCIQREEYLLAADLTRTSTYFKNGNLLVSISLVPTPGNNSSKDRLAYDKLLSTIKFITTPTVIPTISQINKAKLLDTSSWVDHTCGTVSFKLPSSHTPRCTQNNDGTFDIYISQQGSYSGYSILIRKYNGGSRRQYWISSMNASPSEVSKYVRFQETQFGKVSGLDVFASGGWWQGGYSSPILIANDTTLVYIYGGRDFRDDTGEIVRWDITDTIASTIVFK